VVSNRAREAGELLAEVVEAAGLNDAARPFNARPIQAWLEAGHAPEAILAGVRRAASRPSYQPHKVFSLEFFGRAIAEEAPRAATPARAPMSPANTAEDAARIEAIERRAEERLAALSRMKRAA